MEFWVLVEGGCLERVGFLTDGCGPSHACGSMSSLLARGKTLANALLLSQKDVLFALGGLPREVEHCALLAINTLHAACRHYVESHRSRKPVPGEQAMSGLMRGEDREKPTNPE
jgi:nitrogen fixation NifU-like protein